MHRDPHQVTAVILAGGRGLRLTPAAPEFMKPVHAIEGIPLIFHSLTFARQFTVGGTVIVANPHNQEQISKITAVDDRNAIITIQMEPTGFIDALWLGLYEVDTDWTMVLCCDNVYSPGGEYLRGWWDATYAIADGYVVVNQQTDNVGHLTTFDKKFIPRRSDPEVRPRWIGPLLFPTAALKNAIGANHLKADVETVLNHAVNSLHQVVAVEMSCFDLGVINT